MFLTKTLSSSHFDRKKRIVITLLLFNFRNFLLFMILVNPVILNFNNFKKGFFFIVGVYSD